MLIKLLVNVFERAKSKLTSTRSNDRSLSDSDNEIDSNNSKQIFSSRPSIIHQQPRLSISKWLCTSPPSINKSISSSKFNKLRRSSSWRSLKERGNNYIGHLTSRTLSFDELHRNDKQHQKNNSSRKRQYNRRQLSHSPILNLTSQRPKLSTANTIYLSNSDTSKNLPTTAKHFDRLSTTLVKYSDKDKKPTLSTKSYRRNQQQILTRNNTSSGGGDSGYSEESFATTTLSSYIRRPLHTSCPHCHCEQRSSFKNYKKSTENYSTDSSTSDTTINKEIHSPDFYFRLFQQKQSLSASRSYPHIKPLPKTTIQSQINKPSQQQQQQRQTKSRTAKRRRHLSCDSSLCSKTLTYQPINVISSPVISEPNNTQLQRHFTTIGMMTNDSSTPCSKNLSSLPKTNHIFGELNLAAIELDSIRTLDYHRGSFSSSSYSSSLTSSSSSLNTDRQLKNSHTRRKQSSQHSKKGTYLVWHEYKNSSLLSATNGTQIFSVIRGDQVRLLRRIGKSTLLVQKEDDGSIGFLPQSCLAHDQINSFLSVKGLRETVL
ncbi:unnamed protein product [Adineta steineri]|uniref:SH3 domain-containing protein n=1 Tax=Adineta steineri TaxID=433720 RepID=A0A818QMY8_9BILA|nr:unnamed protein product [Adineta steineri]CAF3639459.1 unnamed protein product [Adineta steineri]